MSRRPSVTIYDYPEDLNPFKDDKEEIVVNKFSASESKKDKDEKKKFWTFGRSKKKRSNSFSIKSTWNGIFGKKKDSQLTERKPTISTVSSTYQQQRTSYNEHPIPPPRLSKDQQEFDEALGTLARRRKYTLDNSSRYSSSLTVNGDPGRIYDGSPQDTTVSIMGDLTPKPPARRFGQVSPKPTDKIPPLNYGSKSENRAEDGEDRENDRMPVPPKRGGFRSSQRHIPQDSEEERIQLRHENYTDENENMPEDYMFKRCKQDAVRKSNLSINSCVSVGSVYASGRKKRRAPLPPAMKSEFMELPKEQNHLFMPENSTDFEIPDIPVDIAKVAEDINNKIKKRSEELDNLSLISSKEFKNNDEIKEVNEINENEISCCESKDQDLEINEENLNITITKEEEEIEKINENIEKPKNSIFLEEEHVKLVDIEFMRTPEKSLEIVKDISIFSNDADKVILRRKSTTNSTASLPSNDNFSVQDEIEKIEKQIKLLESKKGRTRTTSFTSVLDEENSSSVLQRGGTRRSLQEIRRNFFKDLTKDVNNDDLKIEMKKFPREQNDIKIIRISDPPVPVESSKEPVKIIELHISEPIRQKPEFSSDIEINPIPKPRRHNSFQIPSASKQEKTIKNDDKNYGSSI